MKRTVDPDHRCPGCFSSQGAVLPCPSCGYAGEEDRSLLCLPVLSTLQNDLVVGKPLGRPGGFGITYLGWDQILERRVAIKEYLPRDLAGRSSGDRKVRSHSVVEEPLFRYGLEKFLQEARILAELDHPSIVRVHRFFEENCTAYLVMAHHEGASLDRYLDDRGGRLPAGEAVAVLLPILEALTYIHDRGYVHRDVKPSNIYMRKDGRAPILLDFGAARSALGERTSNVSVLLSPGYTPIEQYNSRGQLGPWTDVYAAAATLYRAVTGKGPPDSNSRLEEENLVSPDRFVPELPPLLCEALLAGLALKKHARPQSAAALSQMLSQAIEGPALALPPRDLNTLHLQSTSAKPSMQARPEIRPSPPLRELFEKSSWLRNFFSVPERRFSPGEIRPSPPLPPWLMIIIILGCILGFLILVQGVVSEFSRR